MLGTLFYNFFLFFFTESATVRPGPEDPCVKVNAKALLPSVPMQSLTHSLTPSRPQ